MPKKLLLAEDSLTIRKVFELALSRSDITITSVDNGEDAVRLAGEISPDLVVADLTLPGKTGFAVAAELHAMEKTAKIPVLILSGTLIPLDEARFKASGARGVLFKPFESGELLENIERLLSEWSAAPEFPKPQEAQAGDERWDFSDVMDEVEAEEGKSAPAPAPPPREAVLPGAILPGGAKAAPALNEFDVSIDEIEERPRDLSAEKPPSAPAPKVERMGADLPVASPPSATAVSPVSDEVEEIEVIEHLEEVEVPMPPAGPVSTDTPASLRILSVPPADPAAVESVQAVNEPVAAPPAVEPPAIAEPVVAEPVPAGDAPQEPAVDAELRKLFAGRAEEIFRSVASEAVEKVMWEMTDRLAAEFSAKLRESVEAVAWEVIPSTAETLIREEIARIRAKAGKPSP